MVGNLPKTRTNPHLLKPIATRPFGAKQSHVGLGSQDKSKIAISVQQKYDLGFKHPDQYLLNRHVVQQPHQTQSDFGKLHFLVLIKSKFSLLGIRKMVKKDMTTPLSVSASQQSKSFFLPAFYEVNQPFIAKRLVFPSQINVNDSQMTLRRLLSTANNQFMKTFLQENCIKQEEADSNEKQYVKEEDL